MKKIAIDAMGGDHAPESIIEGVLRAQKEMPDVEFILYGNQDKIKPFLPETYSPQIKIVHTTEEVTGDDEPVRAIRTKKDASMVRAATAVKDGEADAVMSLGNTGALLAAGIFIVGRIKGITRPALMPTLPVSNSSDGFTLLDAGANATSKPEYLVQWAQMANFYAQKVRGIANPRIALLNNGSESDKGDDLHQSVYQLLTGQADINFVGNIEANEVLTGKADIVVSDGFTGNALLKTIEGTAETLLSLLKDGLLNSGLKVKLGAVMVKPALKNVMVRFDTSKYGGAALMGLKAPVVKAHGRADARAVYYTLKQIEQMLAQNLTATIVEQFEQK
ncbi:phosphate acyltransferase [Amylolactobacillus amylotrophicus DSM 20534]|uniref:Phosphate acyltransferase n=3 Tax=Amylolactobacillus TaxID=2767876 RepID=A0A1L6XAB2_9LACO|nr:MULTISPECIES: phosphate acyltransferase PlsX [Amylolactobacillus]APT17917.1 phosphate acyltransferase [Amylolactobacillus amylophilus DSM 20533 = JCM 1125]KRK38373.1 phosphate acyltransferase [Amylolactobacillus amylotrophicus DSM 20534]KRM42984.1 phosphate acyltransferase [Amylolactobacillus amylophilus DSM 20533 = JCM 1125]GED79853.1 phosphate acyltransferase [Amylolactobacillus amylophilus]